MIENWPIIGLRGIAPSPKTMLNIFYFLYVTFFKPAYLFILILPSPWYYACCLPCSIVTHWYCLPVNTSATGGETMSNNAGFRRTFPGAFEVLVYTGLWLVLAIVNYWSWITPHTCHSQNRNNAILRFGLVFRSNATNNKCIDIDRGATLLPS